MTRKYLIALLALAGVIFIRREQHVLGEIYLHAVTFPDSDIGRHLDKTASIVVADWETDVDAPFVNC